MFKNSDRTAKKTQHIFIKMISWLMLRPQMIYVGDDLFIWSATYEHIRE